MKGVVHSEHGLSKKEDQGCNKRRSGSIKDKIVSFYGIALRLCEFLGNFLSSEKMYELHVEWNDHIKKTSKTSAYIKVFLEL